MTDPVALTADLIRCPSVTPEEGGALQHLSDLLSKAGWSTIRVDRGGVSNLVARWGSKDAARTFGFNGHTDVVPIGDRADWSVDPFGAERKGDWLYGRGATDMKSGVAAFVSAAMTVAPDLPDDAAILLTITGDEEGDATDGTTAILDWMAVKGEAMDVCLVGEPTCPDALGDMIKIGRRGSLNAVFTARGVQGHSAYPHRAKNPVTALATLVSQIAATTLDEGTEHFDASTIAVTTFDTGNPATNVIPASCRAGLNIRFNDAHTSEDLLRWLTDCAAQVAEHTGVEIAMTSKVSGESFLTPPGALPDLVVAAVKAETGRTPELSTTGGTSDARFIKDHCPVVEFGLTGRTMHEVDERVSMSEITALSAIYARILRTWFS